MKSSEFDSKMRAFELSNDEIIRPENYVVCRIDGRNFSTLTRKILNLKPYDEDFAGCVFNTAMDLMECGFSTKFAYTQSDEISILMDKEKLVSFAGKVRKYNSVLAGEASGRMSLLLGRPVAFDCRTIQLPTKELVVDYFRWRRADSEKNCLNMWAYYLLTQQHSPSKAQSILNGKGVEFKNDILYNNGMNFNELPEWQKRGIGIYWREYNKEGYDPINKKPVTVTRTMLDYDVLPRDGEELAGLIEYRI